MRVLIVDKNGDGMLDTVLRAQQAGHQVKWFIRTFDRDKRPVGQGLAERVADWRPWMQPWADLVIFADNALYMSETDAWRARGCVIVGGNNRSAEWEIDRNVGMQVLREAGIPIPDYREFNDYDSAIHYVERHGKVFYSKPCKAVDDKSLSAKTGVDEDPTWQLRRWKKKYRRPPCEFILQTELTGIEYAVGAWFGPAGFADGYEENWETKRLFPADLGQNTGEMGTTLRYVRRSTLADQILRPLEEQLSDIGFIGNVDVNTLVTDDGIAYPLEFTMRFGLPSWMIETALFDCDPIEFLYAVATGGNTRGAHRMNEIAVGVVMSIPPYPHAVIDYDKIIGVPLYGWQKVAEHFHPAEMQAGEDTELMSAGDYIGVATGTGYTVREAAKGAYSVLRKLSMPASPFWRIDIGRRLARELPKLQEHGFATAMEY